MPASRSPVRIARDYLDRLSSIKVAIVYGSFARGEQRRQSDVDLAIAGNAVLSVDDKVRIVTELSGLIGREVDLIDLNEAAGTVMKEALSLGKILFNKDPQLLAKILSKTMVQHEDFDKLRDRLMREKRDRIFDVKRS